MLKSSVVVCILMCMVPWTWAQDALIECPPASDFYECKVDGNKINLDVDEELSVDTTILIITTDDSNEPEIIFVSPAENTLEMSFKPMDGTNKYEMTIGKEADYEQLEFKRFLYLITPYGINLNIRNINDNAPQVLSNESPCSMKENTPGLSGCKAEIYDADAWTAKPVIVITDNEAEIKTLFNPKIDKIDEYTYTVLWENVENLDFETSQIHTIKWLANDGELNSTQEIVTGIEVADVADQPPTWKEIFDSQTFEEKKTVKFNVKAVDGDLGIGAVIYYGIDCPDLTEQECSVEKVNGEITITGIDRDIHQKEIFPCVLNAYEMDDPGSSTTHRVTFIVTDVNDHKPDISFTLDGNPVDTLEFVILEGSKAEITQDYDININDRDFGAFTTYSVKLEDEVGQEYTKAFQIIPSTGYQSMHFTLVIVNSTLLDYEVEEWRNFQFMIVANDGTNPEDKKTIKIALEDWDDE